MMSPIHSTTSRSNPNPNANANLNHLLSFSASQQPNQPQQKGFLQKKVIPVIRRVSAVAGQVSNIAGKVAVVASIL